MLTNISLIFLGTAIFLHSCKDANTEYETVKVRNQGKISVENGKGEKETIDFQCIGCEENIKTEALFEKLIEEANSLTKKALNFPLSFVPKRADLKVIKQDSLIYFDNNKKIKNVLLITAKYVYLAKNDYGNEFEGEVTNSFYMKDNKVTDLSDDIKLNNLAFDDKYINRTLNGYGKNADYIEFTPIKDESIILQSSLSCVDEGSSFQITLENNEEIELKSWNAFNCDGTSYFEWFNGSQINKLKTSRIKYLCLNSRGKSIMVSVPKNESDYFQQLFNL